MCHTPDQLRIISGRSANTEKEERQFNFIKSITNLTSNRHPANVISNAIIRLQASEDLNNKSPNNTQINLLFQNYIKVFQAVFTTQ